jgi:putative MATE family efflux protein
MLSLLVSLALTITALMFAKPLIWGFLGAPPEMRGMSLTYFRICASGTLFLMLYNVTYGILRAYGDSRAGLLFLLAAAALNVGLDLLFVICFKWGVAGAAAATVASQAGCAFVSVVYLLCLYPRIRPMLSAKTDVLAKMLSIARISIPIIAQSAIVAMGFTLMQRLVNSFGPASIEGYAAMGRIENLAHIPSDSFNAAISAFVGQNIGAGKPERAVEGYHSALAIGIAITIVIAIPVLLFAGPLLGIFNIAGESMRRGREHLVLVMFFMPCFVTGNITSGFLQGTGDVRAPAFAGFVNLGARLAVAYLMAHTFIDFRSVYWSMPIAQLVNCAILIFWYRLGRWRGANRKFMSS